MRSSGSTAALADRRKLPHHERGSRLPPGLCPYRRPHQSPFHDLLSQPDRVSLLEKAVGEDYTCNQLLQTLRSMKMTLLSSAGGYIPSYTRTELTDTLHQVFGFRTDYEIITKTSMRTLIKNTKVLERDKI